MSVRLSYRVRITTWLQVLAQWETWVLMGGPGILERFEYYGKDLRATGARVSLSVQPVE